MLIYTLRSTQYLQTALESNGTIGQAEALALATTNLESALGLSPSSNNDDLVLYSGGDVFDLSARIVSIACGSVVHMLWVEFDRR